MASLEKLALMLQRAKDGPPCTLREWETKVLPQTVKKILQKFDLEHTFNKDEPVNQDLELADRFFAAGLELAAEIGLMCPDTESTIRLSREEILEAVEDAPDHLTIGEGNDRITIHARRPEDPIPPVLGGPLAIQVSEELYVPITAGILKSRKVRVQEGPSIDTVFDLPVYSGTPFETIVAFRENRLREEAQWRAGRPGIPNITVASSTTEFGNLGGFAGSTSPGNPALAVILHPAELKICYASFHKAAAAIGYGGYIFSGTNSMIGGYTGGAEGATVGNIATVLLQFPVIQADMSNSSLYDVRMDSVCGRHGLWALSMANQALSNNTHLLDHKVINQSAGPCTEEILYTTAAGLIASGVSGMEFNLGPRSAGGRFKNYLTPLEHWFAAEVFEASARLTLSQANELVLYLLSKYEDSLKDPPKGKSFTECFDIKTLTPTREWQEIYDRVKADLEAHGMSF
jgi:methylamine--corrinoid protein Co-methyltransferase